MKCDICGAPLVEQEVTYTIEYRGKLALIEHVPARVCPQCGERLYSPETVERIQKTIWESQSPTRVMETLVFTYGVG